MKGILFFAALFFVTVAFSQNVNTAIHGIQWKDQLNTAAGEDYLSEQEKLIFFYMNLARVQPQYFADSVLKKYKGAEKHDNSYLKNSPYVTSLYKELKQLKPLPPLMPDKTLYQSANCFAESAGKIGRTGHDRSQTNCKLTYAECCSYGLDKAIDIVVQLLIDHNIPDLGHRKIILGDFNYMGVAIQPHKTYRQNAVMNFK
jgi:uncharacterized protein YkwD